VATAAVAAAVAALLSGGARNDIEQHAVAEQGSARTVPASPQRPNIVFVLADDLSSDLVHYMPHVQSLMQRGMSFSNYTVSDSLCCPSRSSIFTGMFPHNTGVFTNTGKDGGFETFYAHGDEKRTFATALQKAGYETAFLGKYMNGYEARVSKGTAPAEYVPPGWTEWDGVGDGYQGYGYTINHNGRVERYGHAPEDYLTTVVQQRAESFMQSAFDRHAAFMVEVATFTPHFPYVPAPMDEGTFPSARAPRGPAFNQMPDHAPHWLAAHGRISSGGIAALDATQRKRIEDVQSIDRMVGEFERLAAENAALRDTVFVFSSDNGMHLGEYRLHAGKLTAFDTDVVVPLVVTGPGIPAGRTNPAIVQNVDLAPTFEELAGAPVPGYVDGRSLVPLLHGEHPPWRTVALIEHHGPDRNPFDPDYQPRPSGNPPTYAAIRTARYTFVRYADGEREYYDRVTDRWEMDNLYGSLRAARRHQLLVLTRALAHCRGVGCWQAAQRAA
jgi:arylsulfatase A-like enzyme